jgi:hypothetical protein
MTNWRTVDMPDDKSSRAEAEPREHRVTDMHIIAWALTVIAFGTIWVAFQLTLIATDL